MEEAPSPERQPSGEDPWRLDEVVRRRRLRDHARRPPEVNLAEGLALIEFLSGFRGAAITARRRSSARR